jgi:hypothetical protein
MKESRSSDWFTLARVALRAAGRSENDLLEMLERSPTKPAPQRNGATLAHV